MHHGHRQVVAQLVESNGEQLTVISLHTQCSIPLGGRSDRKALDLAPLVDWLHKHNVQSSVWARNVPVEVPYQLSSSSLFPNPARVRVFGISGNSRETSCLKCYRTLKGSTVISCVKKTCQSLVVHTHIWQPIREIGVHWKDKNKKLKHCLYLN